MKVAGICTYSIEQLEERTNIPLFTYWEFMEAYNKQELPEEFIICDTLPKLLTINDLEILDVEYYNYAWKKKPIRKLALKEMDKISFQQRILRDCDLGDCNFLFHMTEFNKDIIGFSKKIANHLLRKEKAVISCSDKYRELLKKHLLNPEVSKLYQDYVDKKKADYPPVFKFLYYIILGSYQNRPGYDEKFSQFDEE